MICDEILPGGRRPDRAARSLAALGLIPALALTQRLGQAQAVVPPGPTIPANAIYANGEPIPDPAGGGYLTYEV